MSSGNAPRALSLNPGKSRTFRILVHSDQPAKPNPDIDSSDLPTEVELHRRMSRLDDHLLVQYPQLVDKLVPWLASKSADEVSSDEVRDYLFEVLNLQPWEKKIADDIVLELLNEGILFEEIGGEHGHVGGPGVGKPPPFSGLRDSIRWALHNVGADSTMDKDVEIYLRGLTEESEGGEIDVESLFHFIKVLFKSGFRPDENALVARLVEANVLIPASTSDHYLFEEACAGKSDPYVVHSLREMLRRKSAVKEGLKSGLSEEDAGPFVVHYLGIINKLLAKLTGKATRAYPTQKVKTKGGKKQPAFPVERLIVGDQVLILTDQTKPQSIESISSTKQYCVLELRTSNGSKVVKRVKKGQLVPVVQLLPLQQAFVDPPPLKIDDPRALELLSHFEGMEWVSKQRLHSECPVCFFKNLQAYQVLKNMGKKAKGVKIAQILEGGGVIEGESNHRYEIAEDGSIRVLYWTASNVDLGAMKIVGVLVA